MGHFAWKPTKRLRYLHQRPPSLRKKPLRRTVSDISPDRVSRQDEVLLHEDLCNQSQVLFSRNIKISYIDCSYFKHCAQTATEPAVNHAENMGELLGGPCLPG